MLKWYLSTPIRPADKTFIGTLAVYVHVADVMSRLLLDKLVVVCLCTLPVGK